MSVVKEYFALFVVRFGYIRKDYAATMTLCQLDSAPATAFSLGAIESVDLARCSAEKLCLSRAAAATLFPFQ